MLKKKILIAPLNWGLGHATRCIPIIRELLAQDFEPILASDGAALELLQIEFPKLKYFQLPSYNIKYSRKGFFLKWKLFIKSPHIIKTIAEEKKLVEKIIKEEDIAGIISDTRWGVRSLLVPSVFITHQVNVLSGITTFLSSRIQQNYIKKFNELWIPDAAQEPSLSGIMGHCSNFKFPVKYLGILSRFEKQDLLLNIDIIAVLSGPEPQRSMLEKILLEELTGKPEKVVIVRGVVEQDQKIKFFDNVKVYNFLNSEEMQSLLNRSKLVITRPGYTSLMDLAKLEKKLFVIPTPGQYEQEYLAKNLKKKSWASGCKQQEFKVEKLEKLDSYTGLRGIGNFNGLGNIFALFQGK